VNEQQMRVDGLIGQVEEYQAALKLNDTRFAMRFARHLGSATTWRKRLCARAWAEIPLEKWEKKLSKFVAEIEGASSIAGLLPGMPIAEYGEQVYDALLGQMSDRRVSWLIGPTGVGKSWTMRWLNQNDKSASMFVHVAQGSKGSMMMCATQLAEAVGAPVVRGRAAQTFAGVVTECQSAPLTLLLDDVHEGGVTMLKLLKHLVDDSRVRLVLGTYPTAWAQLLNGSTDALSEAQQLLGRSIKPVCRDWVEGVRHEDVAAYLRLAAGSNGDCRVCAQRLAPVLRRNGNLRTLADAVELASSYADENGQELNEGLIEAAVHQLVGDSQKG